MELWFKVNMTATIICITCLMLGVNKRVEGKEENKLLKPVFVKLGSFSITSWIFYSLIRVWM